MGIDWECIEFNEYELMILQKFCYKPRFCRNGHYDEKSILSGVKSDKIGFMKDALKNLVRLKIIEKYKAQNRYDYCFPQENYVSTLSILRKYASRYDFIDESILDIKSKKRR
jgi:hypothetical protein